MIRSEIDSGSDKNRTNIFTLLDLVVEDSRVFDPTRTKSETLIKYPKTRNFYYILSIYVFFFKFHICVFGYVLDLDKVLNFRKFNSDNQIKFRYSSWFWVRF